MLIKYKTERRTGSAFPGFDKVSENKSFKLNIEQLTFKKIVFILFSFVLVFFFSSFTDFQSEYGRVTQRDYNRVAVSISSEGNVTIDETAFESYRSIKGAGMTLRQVINEVNTTINALNLGDAASYSYDDWLASEFPSLYKWKNGTFDVESEESGLLKVIYTGLNYIQSVLFSIVNYVGQFVYVVFYKCKWLIDLVFGLFDFVAV